MNAFCFMIAVFLPLIAMFFVFYNVFPKISESTQVFNDFIIENVSQSGYNKSAELMLFRILAIICIILTILLVFLLVRTLDKRTAVNNTPSDFFAKDKTGFFSAAFFAKIPELLFLFALTYYTVLAALTTAVHFSPLFALSQDKIFLITGFLFLLLCFTILTPVNVYISCRQLLLLMQIPVPFLLVLFFVDKYMYQNTEIHIPYAPFYYVFFGLLLLCFVILAVLHAKSKWKNANEIVLGKLIHPIAAITVFIYNSYSACPMYAQPDQHHHGEQLIPWQQIISLGQTAYDEYTPVSGLFPLVNGFIQNILLNGTVSDYSPAISIMVVIFSMITMYLLYRHVDGANAFLFAVFFALLAYNRQYMVLPILLLLFLKELLNKPGLWLKTWIFSCFLAGLYYPLYGAAVLIGTLPLGITVVIRYFKTTDWKLEIKKPGFYIGWAVCLIPIMLCIPLLLRMISHTLIYSDQTILADGISLYGQSVPDFFLTFLAGSHENIRLWLYYGFRFFLPIAVLSLAAGLGTMAFMKAKSPSRTVFILGIIAVILCLSVSYTYTLVRADKNMILSRTAPILIAVVGMFLPALLISYAKQLLPSCVRIGVIGMCFILPMLIYHQVSAMKFPDMWIYPNGTARLVMDDSDKLFTYYEVPDTFIKMDTIDLTDTSMLGDGFMVADQVHYLTDYAAVIAKCEAVSDTPDNLSYLGMDGQGFYYYLNVKACATGYIQAGKGYAAQQKLLDTIKKSRPVIFAVDPLSSFYIYRWMLTEGNYEYSSRDNAFFPKELFSKLYPDYDKGDDYRQTAAATDFGLSAASFGNSADSILNNLHTEDIGDILSLQLDDELTAQTNSIEISFLSDGRQYEGAHITCLTGDGKLLIPLEMNACWLLGSQISDVFLRLYDTDGSLILECEFDDIEQYGITGKIL